MSNATRFHRLRARHGADEGTQQLLSELNRAKVLFQARTVAMVIGAPMPCNCLPCREGLGHIAGCFREQGA